MAAKTNFVNFLIMAAAFVITTSVPSCAKTGYDLYPESQAQDQSPKCQKFVQLCDPYGDYTCCDGLDCFFPQGVSGVGLCLPLPHPLKQVLKPTGVYKDPNEQRHCKELGYFCTVSPPYNCCGGLECIVPPYIFPGVGVCAPKGTPSVSLIDALLKRPKKCQKVGQVCTYYGPLQCCKELSCHIVDVVAGAGVCLPII